MIFIPTQLRRMVQTDNAIAFFHICVLNSDTPTTKPETAQYPEIANLLNQFSTFFQNTNDPPSLSQHQQRHPLTT